MYLRNDVLASVPSMVADSVGAAVWSFLMPVEASVPSMVADSVGAAVWSFLMPVEA